MTDFFFLWVYIGGVFALEDRSIGFSRRVFGLSIWQSVLRNLHGAKSHDPRPNRIPSRRP